MTSTVPSLCPACARRRPGATCEAFPVGIPAAVLLAGADHREPIAGDGGVRFKQDGTDAAAAAFGEWRRTFGPA